MSRVAVPRSNEVYQAAVAELDEHGIPYTLEYGGKHPILVMLINGVEVKSTLPGSTSDVRAVRNKRAEIRRLIRQSENMEIAAMGETEIIEPAQLPSVVEYKGERVVTFEQIDSVHGRVKGTAARNFRESRKRLVCGDDYLEIGSDEIRRNLPSGLFSKFTPSAILITRRGYLKIVKMLNDDRAWSIYDDMLDRYFAVERIAQSAGVDVSSLTDAVMSRIGGMVKGIVLKQTEDVRAGIDLILEGNAELRRDIVGLGQMAPDIMATRDYVPTFTVVADLARVPRDKRYRGLSTWAAGELLKFCARRAYVPKRIPTYPGEKWAFPRVAAIEWLDAGGRDALWRRVNAKAAGRSGQDVLPFPVRTIPHNHSTRSEL